MNGVTFSFWNSFFSGTDTKIDTDLNRLNSEIRSYKLKIQSLFDNCKVDAQILEVLRATNIEDRNNLFTSFSSEVGT